MKKIIALLLSLVMVLGMLAGCSPAANDNSGSEGSDNTGNEGSGEGNTATDGGIRFGASVKDPIKLISLFVGSAPEGDDVPDIENFLVETIIAANGESAALNVGANLFDKDYKISLYTTATAMILSAPALVEGDYGLKYEDFSDFVNQFMPQDPEEDTAAGVVNIPSLLMSNSDVLAKLLEKYIKLALEELETNSDITNTTEGDKVNYDITIDAEALGKTAASVVYALTDDQEFLNLMESFGYSMDEELANRPSKEELANDYQQMLEGIQITAKVSTNAAKDTLYALDADLSISNAVVLTLDYDQAAGTFSAIYDEDPADTDKTTITGKTENGTTTVQITSVSSYGDGIVYTDDTIITFGEGNFSYKSISSSTEGESHTQDLKLQISDNKITASVSYVMQPPEGYGTLTNENYSYTGTLAWTDNGFTLTVNGTNAAGATELIAAVTDANGKVEGKLTIDGEEMGNILFDKTVEGNKTTYTLKSLVFGEVSVDFTDVGLSFYYETGVDAPAAPATYTDLAAMDLDALSQLLNKIAKDNEDLFKKFGLVGGAVPDAAPAV